MVELVDYAGGYPGAAAVKKAGFAGAIRYLCNSPARGLVNKKLTKDEANDYKANGLILVSNWQLGKKETADYRVGDAFATGADMGRKALSEHFALGGSGYTPIYFSVDEDVDLDTWNSRVLPWLNGIASIIGKEWVGVYGGQRSMWWAEEDGFKWRWQTLAWSRYDETTGAWNNALPVQWVDGVNIQQYEIDKSNINGIGIDKNRTMTADFGQWGLDRSPQAKPVENTGAVVGPQFKIINKYGPSGSNRWGARVSNFFLHTEEGNSSAESLANYLNNPNNGASYHFTCRDGILCNVVPLDQASWSVLDANATSTNFCFAGSRAAMSRGEWLARDLDLRIAAWIAIDTARRQGFATNVIAPPYKKQDGFSDHKYVTQCLGIGNHTDVGPNFPWDVFAGYVREYLGGAAVAPIVNMIDAEAKRAAAWIGDRLDKNEQNGRKKDSKYVRFTNGNIYWSPTTGAHAVPGRLLESYGRYDYEAGFLGLPIGDHTVLKDKDGKVLGGVQGFEGGAIYRREGDDPGYAVGGDIRNMWNRSGFENGPYGWPAGYEKEIVPGVKIQDFTEARLLWAPGKVMALKPTDGPDEVLPVF